MHMPELPEVEIVRRGLAPALVGRRLIRVEARRPDLRFPLPEGFVQRLTGARIEALERRGKYMLAPTDRDETLILHLGMSGRFVISDLAAMERPNDPPHTHVVFETDGGARVIFVDPRRFGFMDVIASADLDASPRFTGMGPEPLGAAFTADHLAQVFAGRRQAVKTLLLDQRIVAGVGNIYACEALHGARLSPTRPAGEVDHAELVRLAAAVRRVLRAAIVAGGSTLRDFADTEGRDGYFQHAFRVYDRAGESCPRRGCAGVIARIVQAGRSTFHCPVCQT